MNESGRLEEVESALSDRVRGENIFYFEHDCDTSPTAVGSGGEYEEMVCGAQKYCVSLPPLPPYSLLLNTSQLVVLMGGSSPSARRGSRSCRRRWRCGSVSSTQSRSSCQERLS